MEKKFERKGSNESFFKREKSTSSSREERGSEGKSTFGRRDDGSERTERRSFSPNFTSDNRVRGGQRRDDSSSRDGGFPKREGGFERREGGSDRREGGFQKREGGFERREGGFQKREGGFERREGGSDRREGGFPKREGGFERREGGFQKREGGFERREGGFPKREGGFERREGGFPKREGGFERREGGFQKREGGFERREGGFPKREGGFERREGGFPKREGGFERREGGFPKREGGFERREGGFQKREGGFERREGGFPKREGGFERREGGFQKREGGFERREGGSDRREGSFQRRDGGSERRDGGAAKPYVEGFVRRDGGFQRREGGPSDRKPDSREPNFRRREGNDRYEDREEVREYKASAPQNSRLDGKYEEYPEQDKLNVDYELLKGDIRLNRYVSMSGICSRRDADKVITDGRVSVNGEVVLEMGSKVTVNDTVTVDGKIIKGEKNVYIIMNKPKDFVTTMDDPNATNIVTDLLGDYVPERVYPVGRLDKSSVGVLILTNDGELTKILTHPSYNKKKLYHVFIDKDITNEDMEKIASGIELEDGMAFADEISLVDDNRREVGVEIHSGRNRIVRRMFEHLDYRVRKLDRVIFAGLTKKNLKRGEWRYLTGEEVASLKSGVNL